MPIGHPTQEDGGHDDEEKEPAEHDVQELFDAPTAAEDVPEGHGEQALVPLMYLPAPHAAEQEKDPAAE